MHFKTNKCNPTYNPYSTVEWKLYCFNRWCDFSTHGWHYFLWAISDRKWFQRYYWQMGLAQYLMWEWQGDVQKFISWFLMTNFNCSPIPTIPFLDLTFLAPEVTKLSIWHVHSMQSTAEGTDQISSSHNQFW